MPSNFDDEIRRLRAAIEDQLKREADRIVKQEIEKVLGRVKIVTFQNMQGQFEWWIEPAKQEEQK